MIKLALAALLVVVSVTAAEARHRRHSFWPGFDAYGYQAPPDDPVGQRRGRTVADLIPPQWQQQPKDTNWDGVRYMAPDNSAWAALYKAPAERESRAAHMQSVAFVDGEEITYVRGERDWIAVSGTKQDRIVYRKAVITCDGKTWQHMALEYPAEDKRAMDKLIIRMAAALDLAARAGCVRQDGGKSAGLRWPSVMRL